MITREDILEALNSYRSCNQESLTDIFERLGNCDSPFGEVIDLAQHITDKLNES